MKVKGSLKLEHSKDERSKNRNKAIVVLRRSNALICFTKHILKRIKNEDLFRYA